MWGKTKNPNRPPLSSIGPLTATPIRYSNGAIVSPESPVVVVVMQIRIEFLCVCVCVCVLSEAPRLMCKFAGPWKNFGPAAAAAAAAGAAGAVLIRNLFLRWF